MHKQGDCSRKRRLFGCDAKTKWYAMYRSVRFSASNFLPHHHGQLEKIMNVVLANKLLNEANAGEQSNWKLPFPMGVFGTLRENQCNNRLMHYGKVSMYRQAFLPHFYAQGLSIRFQENATAPFEVFFYNPDEWNKMIRNVDALEGFSCDRAYEKDSWGYYRTLAWIYVFPENFKHELFEYGLYEGKRDLKIPKTEWNKFEKVPAWVYSSKAQNKLAQEAKTDTVIWG